MNDFKTIKDLVIETCESDGVFPSYEKLTALVMQHFPTSKWKRTHWHWYKSKINTGEISIPGFLVVNERDRRRATNTKTRSAIPDIYSKIVSIKPMTSRWHAVKEIVEKLDAEPLTHLMLGHRELFHSNLLAWFFRCLQHEADAVFGSLTTDAAIPPGQTRKVEREKGSLDLCFHWPNRRSLVIENKVFSLPDEDQLTRYTSDSFIRIGDASLYLLSLSNPNWNNDVVEIEHQEWRWLSFQKLAELIRSALPAENFSDGNRDYFVETMRHYAGVIDLLHDLADNVMVKDSSETVRLPDDVKAALDGSRLMSSMAKLRAKSIEQYVRRALNAASLGTNVDTGMAHSKPFTEWFCPFKLGFEAGWQVQDDQFRLAIRMNESNGQFIGRGAEKRVEREDFAKQYQIFFDFSGLDSKLGTDNTTMRGFCHFDPNFVYCYKKVPDLTVSQLTAAAIAVATRALTL